MRASKSLLFVPGQRPERFAKAAASGADEIIIDLEDAVGPDFKVQARNDVAAWFEGGGEGIVRINGLDTPWAQDDLSMLGKSDCSKIMVPKVNLETLNQVASKLPETKLIALIETAEGLSCARELATCKNVERLSFGNLDFSTDLRVPTAGAVLDPARFELVFASRLANLPKPIDGVTVDVSDIQVIEQDAKKSCELGFGGKLCIHPAQVNPVNEAFLPSNEEIEWAKRVITALEADAGSAVQLDGKMIDQPLINKARQILEV